MDRALNDCCRSFAFLFLGIVKFLENGTVEPYLPFISTLIRSSFLWNKSHCFIKRHIGQTAAKCYFHRILTPWWGNFEQRMFVLHFLKPWFFGGPQKTPGDFDFVPWPKNGEIDILDAFQRMVKASAPWFGKIPVVGCGCVLPGWSRIEPKTIGQSDENGEVWRKRLQKSSVYCFKHFK